jgi:hypothetical protein
MRYVELIIFAVYSHNRRLQEKLGQYVDILEEFGIKKVELMRVLTEYLDVGVDYHWRELSF